MNLDEAIELMKILTACSPENTVKLPEIRILFNHGEGYTLHIKTHSVSPENLGILMKSSSHINLESANPNAT